LRSMSAISVLLIDSSVPGSPHGELDASTLTWLDSTLASEKMHPAFLFLHHPPFSTGIGHMDLQNLRNADDLAAILRRHARVRLIAAGMSTAQYSQYSREFRRRSAPHPIMPSLSISTVNFPHPSKSSRKGFICMPGFPGIW
jgi:3',5'-cyclic AMP phosphodiesterase CpdA